MKREIGAIVWGFLYVAITGGIAWWVSSGENYPWSFEATWISYLAFRMGILVWKARMRPPESETPG